MLSNAELGAQAARESEDELRAMLEAREVMVPSLHPLCSPLIEWRTERVCVCACTLYSVQRDKTRTWVLNVCCGGSIPILGWCSPGYQAVL